MVRGSCESKQGKVFKTSVAAGDECLALARSALFGQHRRFVLDPAPAGTLGCTAMADSREMDLVRVHFKAEGPKEGTAEEALISICLWMWKTDTLEANHSGRSTLKLHQDVAHAAMASSRKLLSSG